MSNKIYTVSQLNRYVKQHFDSDIILSDIMISGEISNFKLHSSGHCYFSLKDASSSIKCVAFRSNAMRFRFTPQNGMKVIAGGYVSVYERDGAYQLYVRELVPSGVGELAMAFEQLKQKLAAEGIFSPQHKQALPSYPQVIGVVTSRTGAVIRDICRVAARRNPLVKIVLYPSLVQGGGAAEQIASGIEFFNKKYPVDVIIAGRGGGSMEDLWAFNEEIAVRAVFSSKIPIISAVGHETDYTLCDLASDVRAATPSQAAELAVPELTEILAYINALTAELKDKTLHQIQAKRSRLELLIQTSMLMHGERLLLSRQQRLDELMQRLQTAAEQHISAKSHTAELLHEKLQALSPMNVLSRGYSMVKKGRNFIHSAKNLQKGDDIELLFGDGKVKAKVIVVNIEADSEREKK